jgi:hypothetical protein
MDLFPITVVYGIEMEKKKKNSSFFLTNFVNNIIYIHIIYNNIMSYISVTITILGVLYRPVSYLKHEISETGFCPHFR